MATQVEFGSGFHKRNPDVLTCIANLSNDEVFTPPSFANQMLDTLAQGWAESNGGENIWTRSDLTFLDPFTKSGVFLREITKRLTEGLENEIPDLATRVDHILTKQVFGIGITNLTALLARRSVYCAREATSKHSIAPSFTNPEGNIWFEPTQHSWVGGNKKVETADEYGNPIEKIINGRCKYCGASQESLGREDGLETHAYKFIHTDDIKSTIQEVFGQAMQFDVIIGNPPYQLSTGDTSDSPIYHKFVKQAMEMCPRFLVMVTPSRWFTGGKGLGAYRAEMISDRHLVKIVDFPNSMETFPGVEIKGGVSYFLWDNLADGDCEFSTVERGEVISTATRDLRLGDGVLLRDNRAYSIIEKVRMRHAGNWLSESILPQTPFGLYTNFENWSTTKEKGYVRLYKRGLDEVFVDPAHIVIRTELIPKIKVLISMAYNGGDALPHQVIGRPVVTVPNSVCTQTYMVVGSFENSTMAKNLASYLGTRFVRFLVRQRKISQHNRPDTFAFVPALTLDKAWSDEDLYELFELTDSERSYIESQVKEITQDSQVED